MGRDQQAQGLSCFCTKEFAAKALAKEPMKDRGLHHLCKGQLGDLTRNEPQEEAGTEPSSWEVLRAIPVGTPVQLPHIKGRPPGEGTKGDKAPSSHPEWQDGRKGALITRTQMPARCPLVEAEAGSTTLDQLLRPQFFLPE